MPNICTIYSDIYSKVAAHITIDEALDRIKTGVSRNLVESIRAAKSKTEAQDLKKKLPSVCFSGKFNERHDSKIIEHSGFIVLDFDNLEDVETMAAEVISEDYVYAAWVSPSGNGLKALVKVADGKQHRAHFAALKARWAQIDDSGVNESRVCYESWDEFIYINRAAIPFTKLLTFEKVEAKQVVGDERAIFEKLLKWLTNKGNAFASGQRNVYVFRLASACCRYGIREDDAERLILAEYPTSNDFTTREAGLAIKSAYKRNSSNFGTAQFESNTLVDKLTRKEVEVPKEIDLNEPVQDVIYGNMVREKAMKIHSEGYELVSGIGVKEIDYLFKSKAGEITCLTGIGNSGKSTFYKWRILMRVLLYGEKFAAFAPEDNPPEEYYHDFVEMLLGTECTPVNSHNPNETIYWNAYNFVSDHIFYLYPKTTSPTPQYILEKFLEVIIKHGVKGVCIDPHNQLSHDYNAAGRTDQYLEQVFFEYARFAQSNSVYFEIIAHPKQMSKLSTGNYECPDVFDLAGGAMWSAKMDNITVYHRPLAQTDPSNPTCEFHSKKIRRQKTVGKKGFVVFEYNHRKRRFEFSGHDPMQDLINMNRLDFCNPVKDYVPQTMKSGQRPDTYRDPSEPNPTPDNPYAGIGHHKQVSANDDKFWNE
jgi:hypothetical protein